MSSTPSPAFICPITQSPMLDPVTCVDGHTYERDAIARWLTHNDTSPTTNLPLASKTLVPNWSLKTLIDAWRSADASGVPPTSTSTSASPLQSLAPTTPPSPRTETPLELHVHTHGTHLHLQAAPLSPEASPSSRPTDVCVVLDTSGSMGSDADSPGGEKTGMSMLNLVQHAASTVAHALGPEDKMAVVEFNTRGVVAHRFAPVTQPAQKTLSRCIRNFEPTGTTNLWDGLQKGLALLAEADSEGRQQVVILLTDGQPNPEPPRGSRAMLERAMATHAETHKTPFPVVHTFGFGYSLDSALLHDLARLTRGTYSFIPDAGMVGTVFVNRLANVLANCATDLRMRVELPDGARLDAEATTAQTMAAVTTHSWGVEVSLGSVQHGQPRTVCLALRADPVGTTTTTTTAASLADGVTMAYVSDTGTPRTVEPSRRTKSEGTAPPLALAQTLARQELTEALRYATDAKTVVGTGSAGGLTGRARVERGVDRVRSLADQHPNDTYLHGCVQDLEGQVSMALQLDAHFMKWGQHYLPSLLDAHHTQECNNFKDPGVQLYGGELFQALRDRFDDVFNALSPPTPSNRQLQSFRGGGTRCAPAAPVSMRSYNACGNACFRGDNLVRVSDGTRRVDAVAAGDVVCTADGRLAQVACVLETRTPRGASLVWMPATREMNELAGPESVPLCVTPHHPVDAAYLDGDAGAKTVSAVEWVHPKDVPGATAGYDAGCAAVFSFLLRHADGSWASTMVINGVACVTLAHGLTHSAVAAHPFYGTEAVVEELRQLPGFASGRVVVRSGCVQRDGEGAVVGLRGEGGVMVSGL